MAWPYKDYQREQSAEDRVLYAKAEEDAQGKPGPLGGQPAGEALGVQKGESSWALTYTF